MSALAVAAGPRRPVPAARTTRPEAARTAPVRLTRRGRLVVLMALTLLVVAAVVALGRGGVAVAGPTGAGVPAPATELVVVQPGETLWSIAQAVAPTADPRETVERLRSLNGLEGSVVVPGQPLVVPAGG